MIPSKGNKERSKERCFRILIVKGSRQSDIFSHCTTSSVMHLMQGASERLVAVQNRREMAPEFCNIVEVAQYSIHFDRLTEHRVAHDQVNGVKGKVLIVARLGHTCKIQVISQFQIVTKPVVMEGAGANCPKFFGSLGVSVVSQRIVSTVP
jgi:hypothetical protein